MAATILTSDHYDALRALIAPDVTVAHISDEYLSQPPFAPDGERQVRKRLRAAKIDVDTLTGDALENARLAMMHTAMDELCVSVPQLLRQTQLEIATEVQSIDWKEKQAHHLSKADERIADVIAEVEDGAAVQQRTRALPFGAVGTERREKVESVYPYRRRSVGNIFSGS